MRGSIVHCLLVILLVFYTTGSKDWKYDVTITAADHNEVVKYGTAITFNIDVQNEGDHPYKVTAIPRNCCLVIDANDTACDIMKIGRPVSVELSSEGENRTKRINFLFRNLYARYRKGNCSFTVRIQAPKKSVDKLLVIDFNTIPTNGTNCLGVDQDPDRNCSAVDCAIKYKGKRNFYRNSTRKCEPVTPCNTRAKDGITVIGYYDWDDNNCVLYEWVKNENFFKQVESDTHIPDDVPTSDSEDYDDLEPNKLMMKSNKDRLECNHGRQKGIHCECDDGWISSGINRDNPLKFHWCDTRKADPSRNTGAPRHISKALEIIFITLLTIANLGLAILWLYLLIKIACPNLSDRIKFQIKRVFYRVCCCLRKKRRVD